MKVKALASLSGPAGRHAVDDEFVVDAAVGTELINRGIAVEVITEPAPVAEAPTTKPAKAKTAAKE